MADEHKEILDKIGEVKTELDTVKASVSGPSSSTATNTQLDAKTKEIIEAVKGGKDENKAAWEAALEGLGFKDVVAAFKDQSNLTSAIPLAIGALGVLVVGKLFDVGKLFNAGLEKITRAIGRHRGNATSEGRILALSDSGLPTARRRSEAEAAPIIAMARSTLSPTELGNLKSALEDVNPHIRTFNSEARNMPSARTVNGARKAVHDLNPVIVAANPTKIGQVAAKIVELKDAVKEFNQHPFDVKKLEKLNKAVEKSKPVKIGELATQLGHLVTAQQNFQPGHIPDANTMRTAARAAKDLARAGGDVRQAFNGLKTAALNAANAINSA